MQARQSNAGVLVLEDRDDLGLGEAGLPHVGSFGVNGRDSTILHGSDYRGSIRLTSEKWA
ncbi:MAG: hypothetical protein M3N13_09685 [Candidatus Eremiobacteraeota bacterium]|nr:hypothetical protein [Candidatus Eremiobacteraeota bacterium]